MNKINCRQSIKKLLSHSFILMALLMTNQSLYATAGLKKTPKYLISPYVEVVSGSCYVIKIDYFRYYNPSEGLEDTYYVQGRSSSGGVAFMRTENQSTYEGNFKIDVDFNADKMADFSDEKLFRIDAGSKEVPVVIGEKIRGFLNNQTDGNSSYNNRRGTLILGYIQRLCFDVNEGQTLAEVNSGYQEKLLDDEEWITQFDNLMILFNTYSNSYLQIIGTASVTYEGDQNESTESNIDLAGKRASAGVNFYIDKFNSNSSVGNLVGSCSYNSSSNTLSLSGDGTERITARNGGITSSDTVDNDFYVDQCIYFRLLR